MSRPPAVGDIAPDFTLPAWTTDGETTATLSAQRGKAVVLAFYPADNTPGCTRQLCSYRDDLDLLADLDVVLWGISTQDTASHRAFAEKRRLPFPLLADTDKSVVKAYGVNGPLMTKRSVFVIDPKGRVAWSHVSTLGLTHQKLDSIADVVRRLGTYPAQTPVDEQGRDRNSAT
ncbi:MAG TPA: peroxiredoxin [Cellulomonadaceae bacterium]|nr:peroxiredoxin [Cellulomonadaceae bacterium]